MDCIVVLAQAYPQGIVSEAVDEVVRLHIGFGPAATDAAVGNAGHTKKTVVWTPITRVTDRGHFHVSVALCCNCTAALLMLVLLVSPVQLRELLENTLTVWGCARVDRLALPPGLGLVSGALFA